ncbi:MAG: von Willebrand factor type A domain-containing protein [Deltaproteobacteria bacterium]|nr:von Willebrand factor type A domain-containing protein [Deltaproteobacteria bacterium]
MTVLALTSGCGLGLRPARHEPLPGGGYAAFAHYGTNPVIDSAEEALVRVGLSADRASWALVRHYLDRGRLPPPEAVRVEECVAAMSPGPDPARSSAPITLRTALLPSPFRPGWHVLVATVVAPGDAASDETDATGVIVLGRTPDGALERALSALGAELRAGDATELPEILERAERVVLVSAGAGLGGPEAQAPLLDAIARAHASGVVVSVAGHVGPGLDDALLDRIAEAGGGLYDLIVPGEEPHLARRLTRVRGLDDLVAELRLDPAVVSRWRLVGHESRVVRTAGLAPTGGRLPAGEAIDLVVEVKLASPPSASPSPLGRLRLRARDAALDEALAPALGDDARARAVVVIAASAEKLRGSFWLKDTTWPALSAEVERLASPALRAELGGVIARASALAPAGDRGERPTHVVRRLP